MTQPTPVEIVANYLANCRPPVDASTAQIAAVLQAWNELAAKLQPPKAADA